MAYEILAANFQNGDVIYGLDSPRAKALEALAKQQINRTQPITKIYCCGLFSSTTEKTNIIIQNDITNAVWDPKDPTKYSSNKSINRTLVDGQRGVGFKGFLANHPNYDVASREDPELDPMKKAKNAWQRTSKAGIEYHVKSQGCVHFIMTDLDIAAVASKKGHGASITSGELRWLYRHQNVDAVKNHVRFYFADRELTHANVFSDPAWEAYSPKHTYGANWESIDMNMRLPNMIEIAKGAV